ncbi:MAG: hypothetical protein LBF60_08950 [Treponema sp.]|nr:hypothetical protein [Treponema sp.]
MKSDTPQSGRSFESIGDNFIYPQSDWIQKGTLQCIDAANDYRSGQRVQSKNPLRRLAEKVERCRTNLAFEAEAACGNLTSEQTLL